MIRILLNIYDGVFCENGSWLTISTKTFIIDNWHGSKCRNGLPKVFCKKGVPANFGKFTGKHLY